MSSLSEIYKTYKRMTVVEKTPVVLFIACIILINAYSVVNLIHYWLTGSTVLWKIKEYCGSVPPL